MQELMKRLNALSVLSWKVDDLQYVLAFLESRGVTHTGTIGSVEMALHRALE